jgi:hypothetical protein
MKGGSSVAGTTGVVLRWAGMHRVFAYRSGTDDGNPSYAIWRWVVEDASDGGSKVTVSWDLNPATFWRRLLLARVRARQLRREVPASIDSLARVLQEQSA